MGWGTSAARQVSTPASRETAAFPVPMQTAPPNIKTHLKIPTLVMVEPRWECTPTSSTMGSALTASRNHCEAAGAPLTGVPRSRGEGEAGRGEGQVRGRRRGQGGSGAVRAWGSGERAGVGVPGQPSGVTVCMF